LSILLLIAPILGSFGRAILQEVAIEGSTLTHSSLISWPTYRECSLVGLTNGLDTSCTSVLVRTNGRNISLDLHPLHRLRGSMIGDNAPFGVVVCVLFASHITSWKNHDLGKWVRAGVCQRRKFR